MEIQEVQKLVEDISASKTVDDKQLAQLENLVTSYENLIFKLGICRKNRKILTDKINESRGWII